MKSPKRVLAIIVCGVLLIAGAGWLVGAQLRSPADEAASRKPPPPSFITVAVEKKKLTSTVTLNGTLAYGSPLPVTLGGMVGTGTAAGTAEAQRVTRPPRVGRVREGSVLMEVNGRPVFTLRGREPMHRTIALGTSGADVRQLQRALRRLGFNSPTSGTFDQGTAAALKNWYAKKGYEAQEPNLEARRAIDELRRGVRSAEETLLTEKKALDEDRDVYHLKAKYDNARREVEQAQKALRRTRDTELTPDDRDKIETLQAAVRTAEESLLEAEQALEGAKPEDDKRLLELKVANASQNLDAANAALANYGEQQTLTREKLLEEQRKALRTADEAFLAAERELRNARRLSPQRLKVTNARQNLADAKRLLAEQLETYGVSLPPGEIVFLPSLPARIDKVEVKAGAVVENKVATVTSSAFAVTGSVDVSETKLLKVGLSATLESGDGRTFPAKLTAIGEKAKVETEDKPKGQGEQAEDPSVGAEPVLLTPTVTKGLRPLVGTPVTVRVSVGETDDPVLSVPVAAVVTSADGKPRVQVETSTDKTKDVEVRTGLTADGNVEVTPVNSGDLKEGDRVVVGNA
ncbi:Putative peptidoglycan binding domain-containing protein [Sinosporangium album]|uniref:Putative peptidoglycan binding domain-containing protein n=1 Tax=Sinosporangium album TaxID=504805 RepID=A0A1G8ALJ2_9ACTN|nr:peptidoglycan-binding protein [Sinosporangium album]SDH21895.1 Putative peptidoglycan binding domain-containing protein [Sinosporangium album]